MNFRWTAVSTFPDKLYRVCRHGQKTSFGPRHGFLAANPDALYFGDSQIPAFVDSLIAHRRQDHIKSAYISFFEDLCEAQQWCLAADDEFGGGGGATIAVIDLKSPAIQDGITQGKFHGWRVVEVAHALGFQENFLGQGGMDVESEWMFIGRVPREAVIKQISCEQVRQGKL